MNRILEIEMPSNFSFRHTVMSHGWCELPPFEVDEANLRLTYIFSLTGSKRPVSATISESARGRIQVESNTSGFDSEALVLQVKHILRLDDDLSGFYSSLGGENAFEWVANARAGRMLRSPTVFEDLVKTLCTTNCSWGLTKKMTANLVNALGEIGVGGCRSFPTAESMASVTDEFYRDEIRAGYRAPYFAELARSVAEGNLDPESWLTSELSTADLRKEIKKVKGVGDYAADNLLKLLGRYDGLALDSWIRSQFYKKHNGGKECSDKKIERHYRRFGEWRGLVVWCDMTEKWFLKNEDNQP